MQAVVSGTEPGRRYYDPNAKAIIGAQGQGGAPFGVPIRKVARYGGKGGGVRADWRRAEKRRNRRKHGRSKRK